MYKRLVEDYIKKFSDKELFHILSKPKYVVIKSNLKKILYEKNGAIEYTRQEDEDFFNKYSGKEVYVYEWCNDWWICEDDNYPITEECFDIIKK